VQSDEADDAAIADADSADTVVLSFEDVLGEASTDLLGEAITTQYTSTDATSTPDSADDGSGAIPGAALDVPSPLDPLTLT
jgi:hypothetical protein